MRLKSIAHGPKTLFLKILGYLQRKKFGVVLNPTLYWARMPGNGFCFLLFYRHLMRTGSPLSKPLRHLVMTYVSGLIHCKFCIDINTSACQDLHIAPEKLYELPHWRTCIHLYTAQEQAALAYAQAMTENNTVSDAIFCELENHFPATAILELTTLIAFQNLSARFNHALDIPAQGLCHNTDKKVPRT